MSGPPTSPRATPLITPSRIIVGICLTIPFVAMMWVSSYQRMEPTFIGMPFFYWYQMLWVPLTAILTAIAYVLVRREERAQKSGESQ